MVHFALQSDPEIMEGLYCNALLGPYLFAVYVAPTFVIHE